MAENRGFQNEVAGRGGLQEENRSAQRPRVLVSQRNTTVLLSHFCYGEDDRVPPPENHARQGRFPHVRVPPESSREDGPVVVIHAEISREDGPVARQGRSAKWHDLDFKWKDVQGQGKCCKILKFIPSILHIILCLPFLAFFISSMTILTSWMTELTLEMLSPPVNYSAATRGTYSATVFIISLCTLFIWSIILSYFWEVYLRFLKKPDSLLFKYVWFSVSLIVMFLLVIISAAVWSEHYSFPSKVPFPFLTTYFILSYCSAAVLIIMAAIVLFIRQHTRPNGTKITKKWLKIVIVMSGILIFIFCILCGVIFAITEAQSVAILYGILIQVTTAVLLYVLWNRGVDESTNKFCMIKPKIAPIPIVLLLIQIIIIVISQTYCERNCQLSVPDAGNHTVNVAKSGYPICDKKWGSLRLAITDMTFFASLAYKVRGQKKSEVSRYANAYFKHRDIQWNVEYIAPAKEPPMFFHLRSHSGSIPVNIIGIRGTANWRDWIENIKIWNEVITFQYTHIVFQVQRLPDWYSAWFISISSGMDFVFGTFDDYLNTVEEYVKTINANDTEQVFLVGHSLGGGLAKIIGCRTKIEAVSISSPGEMLNHMKFRYTTDDVKKYTTSVVVENDFINWIDIHGGLVQQVSCSTSDFFKCHSIRNTFCELKKKCGVEVPIKCQKV